MARARVDLTCDVCGREYTATKICYNRSAADSWEDYMRYSADSVCPQCFGEQQRAFREEEKAQHSAAAAAFAAKVGWPKLTGSEKQVQWAETLRKEVFDKVNHGAGHCTYKGERITKDNVKAAGQDVMKYFETVTSAKLYIDNHERSAQKWLDAIESFIALSEQRDTESVEEPIQLQDVEPTPQDIILYPAGQKYSIPVEVKMSDELIQAVVPYNETFCKLVQDHGYKWLPQTYSWVKKIGITTETAIDTAAELTNKLLAAGFAVKVDNEEVRSKAINADFVPEHQNWVTLLNEGNHKGKLCIFWKEKSDKLYSLARSLPGAKWVPKAGIVVRVEHYKEVQDFAQLYGFKFSPGAIKAIEEQAEKMAAVKRVTPKSAPKVEEKDGLADILATKGEGVLDELKDEPL